MKSETEPTGHIYMPERIGELVYLRLVANKDLPDFGVTKGDKGGLVKTFGSVDADSWVGPGCRIEDGVRITGGSLLKGGIRVLGSGNGDGAGGEDSVQIIGSRLDGEMTVFGNIRIQDSTLTGGLRIRGKSSIIRSIVDTPLGMALSRVYNVLFENARISGTVMLDSSSVTNANVSGDLRGEDILIEDSSHYLSVGPVYLEEEPVVMVRTNGGGELVNFAGMEMGLKDFREELLGRFEYYADRGDRHQKAAQLEWTAVFGLLKTRTQIWEDCANAQKMKETRNRTTKGV